MVFARESTVALRTSVNIPQRGCERLHADVTQPVMWTEEDGLKWVHLCRVLGTHGVGDGVHAGVRN